MIYQEILKVRGNEVGPNLKITLPAIAGYFQEAAWIHSMQFKLSVYDLMKEGKTWVLTRLIIEIDEYPRHNENLTVVTWPSGYDRHNIFRDYHLLDKNGTVIGKCKSVWVILDLKLKQVIPAPPFITDLQLQHQIPFVPFVTDKIPTKDNYLIQRKFVAGWHDIDINRHVNHISYIRWVIESTPMDVLTKKEIASIDIAFRAESEYGDEIAAGSAVSEQSNIYLHKLTNAGNQKEVALARTRWR